MERNFGKKSSEFAYLMSDNNCEACRVPPGKSRPFIQILLTTYTYMACDEKMVR